MLALLRRLFRSVSPSLPTPSTASLAVPELDDAPALHPTTVLRKGDVVRFANGDVWHLEGDVSPTEGR